MKERIKQNYHWVIVGVVLLALIICGGSMNSFNGTVLIPVTESLGVSRGAFTTAITSRSIVSFVLSLFSGILYVKFGYRKLVFSCLLVSASGFLLGSVGQNLTMMCVACILDGAYSLFTISGPPRIIGAWFHRHYGLVMGVVTSATGIGGSLFSIIHAKIVTNFGWRAVYATTGVLFVLVAFLILLVVRNKPEDMGMKPYGEGEHAQKMKKHSGDHWPGFHMDELKKMPAYYLMVIGTLLSCICVYMAFSVVSPYLQDCGMQLEVAATVQGVMLFSLAGSKLLAGFVSDKIGAKKVALISLVATVVSMIMLVYIKRAVFAYMTVMIYSVALLLAGFMPMILVPSLFGYHSGPKAMGIVIAMVSAGSMIAYPLTNSLRDALGSYKPVFMGTAAVSVGVLVLYIIMFILADKDKKKYYAAHSEEIA